MNLPRFVSYARLLLLAAVIGACQKSVDPDYPNDRGEKIADLAKAVSGNYYNHNLLGWSVDGSELFYKIETPLSTATTGNNQLYALSVKTGTSRLILDDPRWRVSNIDLANPGRNRQSPDGQFLYAAAQGNGTNSPYYLYRINLRQTNQAVIVDSSSTGPRNFGNDEALLSADGNRLAFQYRPDSVRVHNLAGKTSVRIWTTGAIAFSPDGSQLLLRQSNSALYRIVSLSTQSETVIDPKVMPIDPSNPGQFPDQGVVRWHSEGIRYIYKQLYQTQTGAYKSTLGLFIWNVTQQKSTLVWSTSGEESGFSNEAWAHNGQRVVAATTIGTLAITGRGNYILYSTDPTTLKTTKVATGTLLDSEKPLSAPGRLLLSPDNTRLAYTIGTTVYVAPVQP